MRHYECIERFAQKASVSNDEVQHQLKCRKVHKSRVICNKETFDISFLVSYISIFHSARALLYKGYKERSHFAFLNLSKKNSKTMRKMPGWQKLRRV